VVRSGGGIIWVDLFYNPQRLAFTASFEYWTCIALCFRDQRLIVNQLLIGFEAIDR
jgi:hypothetical protein